MRVPIICAWCEAERKKKGLEAKVLGHKEIDVPPGHRPVAHSMCEECAKNFPWAKPKCP